MLEIRFFKFQVTLYIYIYILALLALGLALTVLASLEHRPLQSARGVEFGARFARGRKRTNGRTNTHTHELTLLLRCSNL